MGIIKTLIDIFFYPIIYILTIVFTLIKEFSGSEDSKTAVDAVRDARGIIKEFKDAVDESPVDTNNSSDRTL